MPHVQTLLRRGAAVLASGSPRFGQLTLSTIRGTATDPTGAVLINPNIETASPGNQRQTPGAD
jgi:hypothetical protein